MDEKTKVLISLGASTAANCIPCFEYYFGKASAMGLTPEEIQEASEIGEKINKGAQMAIRKSVNAMVIQGGQQSVACNCTSESSCCE